MQHEYPPMQPNARVVKSANFNRAQAKAVAMPSHASSGRALSYGILAYLGALPLALLAVSMLSLGLH